MKARRRGVAGSSFGMYVLALAANVIFLSRVISGWPFPEMRADWHRAPRRAPFVALGDGGRMLLRGQESEEEQPITREARVALPPSTGDIYKLEYAFRNFNQDKVTLVAHEPRGFVEDSMREFGFRPGDLGARYKKAQQEVIDSAKKRMFAGRISGSSQAEVNRKMAEAKRKNADVQREMQEKLDALEKEFRTQFYRKAGFHMVGPNEIETDIPAMVHRNSKRMAPVATVLNKLVQQKGYEMEDLIGAVVSMTQTAIKYTTVGTYDAVGKNIGGTVVPPLTMVQGAADCDSKSALIGSILFNWPNIKMVGLAIPEHYLMAVYRAPGRGDMFVEHEGLKYVMIEAAGPAWLPPGKVGEYTEAHLSSGKVFGIQPF
ncbi:MAG: hypothetical protein HY078_04470 [Elusimicrobia bacterium]|nr:hypothetical protein [Elusimicrobiota bacterium]